MYKPSYQTKPWRTLYSTKRWQRIRHHRLNEEPLCRFCIARGKATPATVIDHIEPHKGEETLFYAYENTQSLCKTCHDSAKQRFEKSGSMPGCDISGMPIDNRHHWNAEGVG